MPLGIALVIGLLYLLLFKRKSPAETIRQVLIKSGYSPRFADIAVAVARHETGDFTSRLFREYNNAFGMTSTLRPGGRPHFANGEVMTKNEGLFNTYASVEDSAKDFVEYLKWFRYPKHFDTPEAFVAFQKSKGYFADTLENYTRGVKRYV